MSYDPTVWVDGDHVTSEKLNKLEQGVNSMSYTPTVWSAGDVVTAEKLNKLERGVADSGGGSSDLSTAEVTLNIAHGTSVQTDYPYIDEEFNQVSVNDYENGTTDTNSFIIPLYTEGAYFRMDGVDGEPTIVGDAVYDNGYFIVTGDCTITVTGTPMT